MTAGGIRAERDKSSASGKDAPVVTHTHTHTQTSLAETGALQAVTRLVGSGHQGLSKAAVGEDGAVGRAAEAGPVAGEITIVLRGRAPPIHHGPCGAPQPSATQHLSFYRFVFFFHFGRISSNWSLNKSSPTRWLRVAFKIDLEILFFRGFTFASGCVYRHRVSLLGSSSLGLSFRSCRSTRQKSFHTKFPRSRTSSDSSLIGNNECTCAQPKCLRRHGC